MKDCYGPMVSFSPILNIFSSSWSLPSPRKHGKTKNMPSLKETFFSGNCTVHQFFKSLKAILSLCSTSSAELVPLFSSWKKINVLFFPIESQGGGVDP